MFGQRLRISAAPPGRLLLAGLVALVGCGRGSDSRLLVEGVVRLGDAPLTTGTVILRPDPDRGNTSKHEPRGAIDAEGRYRAFTTPGEPGVAPGWYKAAVVATEPLDLKNPYAVRKSLIPTHYNDPERSGLSLEVVQDAPPGAYDLKLHPQ
jgi:hypothetical protein